MNECEKLAASRGLHFFFLALMANEPRIGERTLELTLPLSGAPPNGAWEQIGNVAGKTSVDKIPLVSVNEVEDNDGTCIVTTEEYLLVLPKAEAQMVTRWRVRPREGLLEWHDGYAWNRAYDATARIVESTVRAS